MPPRNPNNPPTQDVENPTEREVDDDDNGVAEKKRKVSSADETAANVNVRPRNLRNKKPTCSLSQPMELIKAYEENSDEAEAENHEIANFSVTVSEKNKEEYFSALTGKKPSRKPKKPRNRNMQKAIDQVLPALDISEIIDEVMIQRWRGLHWWRGSKAFYR
ncbi:uncharacterized protein LOC129300377 [Prosopis cineraria]|uniref:uncharacterized protein LOC129300377 n=1 Tax=Prosopis cineraria TaxID=364024 RepID=UPI0024105F71|nr:uncharacterized protein LOC129300377 [Prosopis cineraria]